MTTALSQWIQFQMQTQKPMYTNDIVLLKSLHISVYNLSQFGPGANSFRKPDNFIFECLNVVNQSYIYKLEYATCT